MRHRIALLFAALICHDAGAQLGRRDGGVPNPPSDGPGGHTRTDFLEVKNETPEPVRLEHLIGPKATFARELACLAPGAAIRWEIVAGLTGEVRMQMFKGDCMNPQVTCQHAIPYSVGLRYAVMRGEGRKCEIVSMPAPRMLREHTGLCGPNDTWAPLTFINRYPDRSMWVTITSVNKQRIGPDPRRAFCWRPQERRMACIDPGDIRIMAEVKVDGNCSPREQPKCTTTMEAVLLPQSKQPPRGAYVELRPNGANCYWTHIAYHPPSS